MEFYAAVRRSVYVEGWSERAAARRTRATFDWNSGGLREIRRVEVDQDHRQRIVGGERSRPRGRTRTGHAADDQEQAAASAFPQGCVRTGATPLGVGGMCHTGCHTPPLSVWHFVRPPRRPQNGPAAGSTPSRVMPSAAPAGAPALHLPGQVAPLSEIFLFRKDTSACGVSDAAGGGPPHGILSLVAQRRLGMVMRTMFAPTRTPSPEPLRTEAPKGG